MGGSLDGARVATAVSIRTNRSFVAPSSCCCCRLCALRGEEGESTLLRLNELLVCNDNMDSSIDEITVRVFISNDDCEERSFVFFERKKIGGDKMSGIWLIGQTTEKCWVLN